MPASPRKLTQAEETAKSVLGAEVVEPEPFVPEVMTDAEIARGERARKASTGEIVVMPQVFNREQLGAIDSFDAAMALAEQEFGSVVLAHEESLLGDGFRKAEDADKERLIGKPLLFLDWRFLPSDFGQDDWVFIHAVERGENGQAIKWMISDGGSGIARDLREYTAKTSRTGGMIVKNGLRKSSFYFDNNKDSDNFGKALSKSQVAEYMTTGRAKTMAQATTYYLDTSA
jgi:hypothetical protein